MTKIKKMLPFLIFNILLFYITPLCINDTGSSMAVLLFIIPILCFVGAFIYGIKYSFDLIYPLLVALLFIPTIFIFYNESAAIYILFYGMIVVTASALGNIFFRKNNE